MLFKLKLKEHLRNFEVEKNSIVHILGFGLNLNIADINS